MVQRPKSGLGRLIIQISGAPTVMAHTRPVGLLWTSDQLVADVTTYATNTKLYRWTFMPSVGFGPANPAIERPQTYNLDDTAIGIGIASAYCP